MLANIRLQVITAASQTRRIQDYYALLTTHIARRKLLKDKVSLTGNRALRP